MRDPTSVSHPEVKAITVFLAATATPARGGLPYLDAVLPAEHRLAAARVLRDLGALPPDAVLYLLTQPLVDLVSDHLLRDRDLTVRYEERFEVEDSNEWMAAMANTTARPTRSPPPPFAPRGRRGWRTSTSRIGGPSTAGWSAGGNSSSGRRP